MTTTTTPAEPDQLPLVLGVSHDEAPRGSAAFQRFGSPFGVAVIAVVVQRLLTSTADGPAAFWWVFGLSALPLLFVYFLPPAKR